VVVLVALAGMVVLAVIALVIGRSRRRGAMAPGAAPSADSDMWNASGIGGATGHAWMAGDRAARARAVTDAARRGPFD
jgi:hypothetical protein